MTLFETILALIPLTLVGFMAGHAVSYYTWMKTTRRYNEMREAVDETEKAVLKKLVREAMQRVIREKDCTTSYYGDLAHSYTMDVLYEKMSEILDDQFPELWESVYCQEEPI